MKALQSLPSGYGKIFEIDMQKNKKAAFWLNVAAFAIAIVMIVPMAFIVPITSLYDMSQGVMRCLIRVWLLVVLMIAYIILHEAVHGIAMKICGTKKVNYGLKGTFAYAGSDDYYDKRSYIFIALAPIALWGAVLAIINPFVPESFFWVVYILQVINVSGAAGDIYVTAKFSRMPKDILVRDSGVAMTVFSTEGEIETENKE